MPPIPPHPADVAPIPRSNVRDSVLALLYIALAQTTKEMFLSDIMRGRRIENPIKNNDLRRSQGVLYIGADEPNLCSALLKIQSHVVLYQFKEKLQPPIASRLGPLADVPTPVSFPVGRHVVRVELAPLFLTVVTLRPILRVVIQLLTVILRTPMALAPFAAADDLVWVIAGRSE
jgi:hypothetical protein